MGKRTTRIGDVLKRAREKKEMTADEVAAQCNVSRARIYQWEASDYVMKKNHAVLARVLGLSVKYLNRVNMRHHVSDDEASDPADTAVA